jgi:Na+/melibiose symporter-like transporter
MAQNIEFKKSIGILFKNKKFMSLAISFGTVNGTFNIYGSLMDDILDPYGFNPNDVSNFGAALMISGIISAGLFGIYVEKTLKYRNTFIICGSIGLLTTVAFPLALKYLN